MSSVSTPRAEVSTETTTVPFRCDICDKQFASEAQLAFHKEIEHVKHLPLSGVA